MINFYVYYNGVLDNVFYARLIKRLMNGYISDDLKPIEHIIKKNSFYSYMYAMNVIKGRWPEAEHIIMRNSYYAVFYAKEVIKGRWIEAEPYIKTTPMSAYRYAKYVLHNRWVEAEDVIKIDWVWWGEYNKDFEL
jgi:hypothetical protein